MLALLGFVTFGLGWFLIGPFFALVALGYIGAHPRRPGIGDHRHAARRRRDAHLERRAAVPAARRHARPRSSGFRSRCSPRSILLVGLFTYRKQLLHDLLLGVVMLNADGPAR